MLNLQNKDANSAAINTFKELKEEHLVVQLVERLT